MMRNNLFISTSLNAIKIKRLRHACYRGAINQTFELEVEYESDVAPSVVFKAYKMPCQIKLAISSAQYVYDGYCHSIRFLGNRHQCFIYRVTLFPLLTQLKACFVDMILNNMDAIAMTKHFAKQFLSTIAQFKIHIEQPRHFKKKDFMLIENSSFFNFIQEQQAQTQLNFCFEHDDDCSFLLFDQILKRSPRSLHNIVIKQIDSKQKIGLINYQEQCHGVGIVHPGNHLKFNEKNHLVQQCHWQINMDMASANHIASQTFSCQLVETINRKHEPKPFTSVLDNVRVTEHRQNSGVLNQMGNYQIAMPAHWEAVGTGLIENTSSRHLIHAQDGQMSFVHLAGSIATLVFADDNALNPIMFGALNTQNKTANTQMDTAQNAYLKDQACNQIAFINEGLFNGDPYEMTNRAASVIMEVPNSKNRTYVRLGDPNSLDGTKASEGYYAHTKGAYVAKHQHYLLKVGDCYRHKIGCGESKLYANLTHFESAISAHQAYSKTLQHSGQTQQSQVAQRRDDHYYNNQYKQIQAPYQEEFEGSTFNFKKQKQFELIKADTYNERLMSASFHQHFSEPSYIYFGHQRNTISYESVLHKGKQMQLKASKYEVDCKHYVENVQHHRCQAENIVLDVGDYLHESERIIHQGKIDLFV